MELIRKRLLLLLGICVMSTWAAVIFVLFTNGNDAVPMGKHVESDDGIRVKQEMTFDEQRNKTNKVYAMNNKKESISTKEDSIMVTKDSSKISIDVLLEMLDESS